MALLPQSQVQYQTPVPEEQYQSPMYQTQQGSIIDGGGVSTQAPQQPGSVVPGNPYDLRGKVDTRQSVSPISTPVLVPKLDNEPVSGGGGGGGASAREALLAQKRQQLIDSINQNYNNQQKDIDASEKFLRKDSERAKGLVNQQRDLTVDRANTNAMDATRRARRDYQDAQLLSRRRFRAAGGAATSGFQELSSLLDREYSTNLNNVETSRLGVVGNADLTAQRALGDLEAAFEKAIAGIESDRRKSRMDKDNSIREVEMMAAEQALAIEEWKARTSAAAAARARQQQQQDNTNKIISSYVQQLASGNANPEAVRAQYAPIFAQYGINPAQAEGYARFAQGSQPTGLQNLTGIGLPDEDIRFLLGGGYLNPEEFGLNNPNSGGQLTPGQVMSAYDPFTQTINPTLQYYAPDVYDYLNQSVQMQNLQNTANSGGQLSPEQQRQLNSYYGY